MKKEDAEEFSSIADTQSDAWWRQLGLGVKMGVHTALNMKRDEWLKGRAERVARSKQLDVFLELKAEGHSNRSIAAITGVSPKTVDRAINASNDAPDTGNTNENKAGDEDIASNDAPNELAQEKKRTEALREQVKVLQSGKVDLTGKKYGTIVIDPPWPMQKIEREVRPNQVEFDYPTMDEDQLRAFRADFLRMAGKDVHVFMWTTHKFLPMALRLFNEYGIKYVLTMVWHKSGGMQPVGLPQYNCEFALYGRIGSPKFIDTKAFNCCFTAQRREHSRKPDEFYDLVRRVTDGDRIDIFSREKREGFDQFGVETDKFEAAE